MTLEEQEKYAVEHILSDKIVSHEFINFFLGNFLGSGISRYVFENALDPTTVIKIDTSRYNANIAEFNVWQHVEYVESINKWFAPVVKMSRCGRILIMKKCNPLTINRLPEKVPAFFTDIKVENFGIYKNHICCLDYASNLLMEKGMTNKLRIAKWNNDEK